MVRCCFMKYLVRQFVQHSELDLDKYMYVYIFWLKNTTIENVAVSNERPKWYDCNWPFC